MTYGCCFYHIRCYYYHYTATITATARVAATPAAAAAATAAPPPPAAATYYDDACSSHVLGCVNRPVAMQELAACSEAATSWVQTLSWGLAGCFAGGGGVGYSPLEEIRACGFCGPKDDCLTHCHAQTTCPACESVSWLTEVYFIKHYRAVMMVASTKVNMAMMPAPLLTRLCPCGPTPYYNNKSLCN